MAADSGQQQRASRTLIYAASFSRFHRTDSLIATKHESNSCPAESVNPEQQRARAGKFEIGL